MTAAGRAQLAQQPDDALLAMLKREFLVCCETHEGMSETEAAQCLDDLEREVGAERTATAVGQNDGPVSTAVAVDSAAVVAGGREAPLAEVEATGSPIQRSLGAAIVDEHAEDLRYLASGVVDDPAAQVSADKSVGAPDGAAGRCWSCGGDAGDNWFDRSLCPEPCGAMHTRCRECGVALDACPWENRSAACGLCGRDPAAGFATVNDVRYCHGDDDPEPTCYMRSQSAYTAQTVGLRSSPDGTPARTVGGAPLYARGRVDAHADAAMRGHAGEIAHGVSMLRHWWKGKQEAKDAWLAHLERYAPLLVEDVDRLSAQLAEARAERDVARVRVSCPEPWPDCRPGACNCDGVYDAAKYRGEDPVAARAAYIAGLADIVVTTCPTCKGDGYIEHRVHEGDAPPGGSGVSETDR